MIDTIDIIECLLSSIAVSRSLTSSESLYLLGSCEVLFFFFVLAVLLISDNYSLSKSSWRGKNRE